MKPIIRSAFGGLVAVLVLAGTATAKPLSREPNGGPGMSQSDRVSDAPVAMTSQPGSTVDALARQLMAREIEQSRASGVEPVVLVGTRRLDSNAGLLFVEVQSANDCGSAGCSIVSFRHVKGQWVRVMDTVGGAVWIASPRHGGMPDLSVDGNPYVWDGAQYRDEG
jgi:hypothetical protein